MSDDEADPELLELLRQSLGIGGPKTDEVSTDTGTFGRDVGLGDQFQIVVILRHTYVTV